MRWGGCGLLEASGMTAKPWKIHAALCHLEQLILHNYAH